jgi:hypothetical protein
MSATVLATGGIGGKMLSVRVGVLTQRLRQTAENGNHV